MTTTHKALRLALALGLWGAPGFAQEVPVRLETTNPSAMLQRRTGLTEAVVSVGGRTGRGTAVSYDDLCMLPCARTLSRDSLYRISGLGVTDSSAFALPVGGGTLRVTAGNSGTNSLGLALAITGGVMGFVGVVLLPVGLLVEVPRNGSYGLTIGGGVTLGAGVVMMIPGIMMAIASATTVTAEDGRVLASGHRTGLRLTASGLVF